MQTTKNEAVHAKIDELFVSPNPADWGGKGYIIDRIASDCGISKAEAKRQFELWSVEQDMPFWANGDMTANLILKSKNNS